jgi:hypothetical protein
MAPGGKAHRGHALGIDRDIARAVADQAHRALRIGKRVSARWTSLRRAGDRTGRRR